MNTDDLLEEIRELEDLSEDQEGALIEAQAEIVALKQEIARLMKLLEEPAFPGIRW